MYETKSHAYNESMNHMVCTVVTIVVPRGKPSIVFRAPSPVGRSIDECPDQVLPMYLHCNVFRLKSLGPAATGQKGANIKQKREDVTVPSYPWTSAVSPDGQMPQASSPCQLDLSPCHLGRPRRPAIALPFQVSLRQQPHNFFLSVLPFHPVCRAPDYLFFSPCFRPHTRRLTESSEATNRTLKLGSF